MLVCVRIRETLDSNWDLPCLLGIVDFMQNLPQAGSEPHAGAELQAGCPFAIGVAILSPTRTHLLQAESSP
jgi:hypothetical protein